MYIVIRKYSTNSPEEVMQKIKAGFLPLISRAPGFIDYYAFRDGADKIVIVNMFDTEIAGLNSTEMAKQWVDDNIAHLYAGPPEIMQGEAGVAQ